MSDEEYYITSKLTKLDQIMAHTWIIPLASFAFISYFILTEYSGSPNSLAATGFFIFGLITTIICRTLFGRKVNLLRKEFYEIDKKKKTK